MTDQHPITPPDKQLVRKWIEDWAGGQMKGPVTEDQLVVATQATQWGGDQELEACCLLLDDGEHAASYGCHNGTSLRAARRPKPSSLKEQALAVLDHTQKGYGLAKVDLDTIRRALEALDD